MISRPPSLGLPNLSVTSRYQTPINGVWSGHTNRQNLVTLILYTTYSSLFKTHTEKRSLFLGIHTNIPGRTQQPDLFSWDSHRYPRAHTATRSLFLGIHTDIPRRTQLPDLFFFFFFFFLGFTQISPGAHSNPISFSWDSHRYPQAHTATRSFFFFSFFSWDSHRYPRAHTATRSLFLGIHTDIPGCTQLPDLFFSFFLFFFFFFFWDSHRYPQAHTATRSFFLGIHTDIPGRTQQPDLFFLGFTQISLGAHSNPISFSWDSHRYPRVHTATRSLFFFFFFFFFPGIHTDIPGRTQLPDLFSLGFTQISPGAHSNPISFSWDSHRYPWAHTATRSLFLRIHTDIPGCTQLPDLFSLGFTQNPISSLGTEIS